MPSHFAIPKTVCMYVYTITNLPTLTVPFSIQDFRPLLTDSFNWKTKQSEIHFLLNTELRKMNTTMADWATPSINCTTWFTCPKGFHFNSLKVQKILQTVPANAVWPPGLYGSPHTYRIL